MNLNPKALNEASNWLLFTLIVLEIFLVIVYLAGIVLIERPFDLFDLDNKDTIPSFFQASQLFIIGLISLVFFICGRHSSEPPSQIFMLTVALLFFYACADEALKIHYLLPTEDHRSWKPIYLGIALVTPFVFYRDCIALWRIYRRAMLLVAIGLGVFVIGDIGLEILKDEFLQSRLSQIFERDELIPFFIEKLRAAVEEFSAMLGASLILYGLFSYISKRLEVERLTSTEKG
ncbi:MAG: hypothetical protein F6K58_28325 [Symploca sp. SIO2E9]|nr:hypothetical protein [Symploca sp. SIO2E9]